MLADTARIWWAIRPMNSFGSSLHEDGPAGSSEQLRTHAQRPAIAGFNRGDLGIICLQGRACSKRKARSLRAKQAQIVLPL